MHAEKGRPSRSAFLCVLRLSIAKNHHLLDAFGGLLHDVVGKLNFFAAAALDAVVDVHQRGDAHIWAGEGGGKWVEVFVGVLILQMFHDAVFGGDNEGFGVGASGVVHDGGGGADKVALFGHFQGTFRMHEQLGVWVGGAHTLNVLSCGAFVIWAAAVKENDVFFRYLFLHIAAKVRIWDEEDLVVWQFPADFDCRGGGDANVAGGFQCGGGVDVGDDGVVWVLLFEGVQGIEIQLFGHRAASDGIWQVDVLVWAENLACFSHEAHAAHKDVLLGAFACLHAESVGVANVVGHFQNRLALVGVGQEADVLFLFQAKDLLL